MGSVYSKADHLAVNSLSFLTMSLFWQDVEVCAAGYLPYIVPVSSGILSYL